MNVRSALKLLAVLMLAWPLQAAAVQETQILDGTEYRGMSRGELSSKRGGELKTGHQIQNPYTGTSVPDRGTALLPVQHLVELALINSPEIRDAEAAWQAAQMDLEEAKGVKWPRVDVSGSSAATKFGSGNPYGNGSTGRVGVTATYTLLDAGKSSHQISNKDHLAKAAEARLELARNKVAGDTVNAYLQIAKYQLLIGAYQGNHARMNELAEKLREIVAALPGRRSEMTQANARVMQAQENIMAATAKKREYQIQLIKLIGLKVKVRDIEHFDAEIPVLPLGEALNSAESHPALRAAEEEKIAAKEMESVSGAAQYPQLDLQASKMSGTDVMGYSDPGQVYLALNWNAFQGFAGEAARKANAARALSAEEKYQQSLNEIEFMLNSAWADHETQSRRIASMETLKQESWQVREDYYIQWQELGRRSLLELLASETEYLNAEVGLINSKIDRSVAASKLYTEAGVMADWLVGNIGPR